MFKVFKSSGIEGNYSISSNPLFVNNGCWAVYPAKHKTTKKAYSVWQFSKKDWEQQLLNSGIINKSNKQLVLNDILENIRLFIGNQSKFKHPNFLTVIEPLEDHKSRVLFVTEYVIGDLYSIGGNDLDEIMITKGLLQVCNGLKFLHESVSSVDLNMNPSSILVTENYDWKIAGLTFLENITNGIIKDKMIDPLGSRMPPFLSIDFRFTSPNLLSKHNVDYIDDLFSICCIVYFLFNDKEMLIKCPASSSIADYERQLKRLNTTLESSKNNGVKHPTFERIPDNFYSTFVEVLMETQESNTDVIQLKQKLTVNDLIESRMFNNELIKMLNYLDEYPTYSLHEKLNFLKALKGEIGKFPKPLLMNKFIPILVKSVDLNQYKKNTKPTPEDEELIVDCSENLILLSQNLSQLTFADRVFPFIQTILKKIPFDSFKILLLKNLSIIQSCLNASTTNNSSNELFQRFSLDLFEKCISDDNSMIVQELTLTYMKTILQFQQYTTIKTIILPKLSSLYSTTTSLKVKNLAVSTFITMVSDLDNKNIDYHSIVDTLLPLIYNTSPTIYSNTKFTNNILQLYICIFEKLNKSTNKSFNIAGSEKDLYDIIMELGFNVWKIAKYISNRQDLNQVFSTWTRIETYLKEELNSHVTCEIPISKGTPVLSQSNTFGNVVPVNSNPVPTKQLSSRATIQTPIARSSNQVTSVMTPKPKIHPLQLGTKPSPKDPMSMPQLSFGQTNTPHMHVPGSSAQANATIDWSSAGTLGVMQPTNKTKPSTPVSLRDSRPTDTTTGGLGSFEVMKPMVATKSKAVVADDDEWNAFETSKITTKSNTGANFDWGDSLI